MATETVASKVYRAFKAWASAHGYNVARSVLRSSPVGTVALRSRRGVFTIELASELDPVAQHALVASGFRHGWTYLLRNAEADDVMRFCGVK